MTPIKIAFMSSAAALALVMPASANEDYSRMSALELQSHAWSVSDGLANPNTDKKLRNAYLRQMHQMKDRLTHLEQNLGDSYTDEVNKRIIGNIHTDIDSAFERAGEKSYQPNDDATDAREDAPAPEAEEMYSAHTLDQALAKMDRLFAGEGPRQQLLAALPAEMAEYANDWEGSIRAEWSGLKYNIITWKHEGIRENELFALIRYYENGLYELVSSYVEAGKLQAEKIKLHNESVRARRSFSIDDPIRESTLGHLADQYSAKNDDIIQVKEARQELRELLRGLTAESIRLVEFRDLFDHYYTDNSESSKEWARGVAQSEGIDPNIWEMDNEQLFAYARVASGKGSSVDAVNYEFDKAEIDLARDRSDSILHDMAENFLRVGRQRALKSASLENREDLLRKSSDAATAFNTNTTWMDSPVNDESGAFDPNATGLGTLKEEQPANVMHRMNNVDAQPMDDSQPMLQSEEEGLRAQDLQALKDHFNAPAEVVVPVSPVSGLDESLSARLSMPRVTPVAESALSGDNLTREGQDMDPLDPWSTPLNWSTDNERFADIERFYPSSLLEPRITDAVSADGDRVIIAGGSSFLEEVELWRQIEEDFERDRLRRARNAFKQYNLGRGPEKGSKKIPSSMHWRGKDNWSVMDHLMPQHSDVPAPIPKHWLDHFSSQRHWDWSADLLSEVFGADRDGAVLRDTEDARMPLRSIDID